jgi:hypothetical protein
MGTGGEKRRLNMDEFLLFFEPWSLTYDDASSEEQAVRDKAKDKKSTYSKISSPTRKPMSPISRPKSSRTVRISPLGKSSKEEESLLSIKKRLISLKG